MEPKAARLTSIPVEMHFPVLGQRIMTVPIVFFCTAVSSKPKKKRTSARTTPAAAIRPSIRNDDSHMRIMSLIQIKTEGFASRFQDLRGLASRISGLGLPPQRSQYVCPALGHDRPAGIDGPCGILTHNQSGTPPLDCR